MISQIKISVFYKCLIILDEGAKTYKIETNSRERSQNASLENIFRGHQVFEAPFWKSTWKLYVVTRWQQTRCEGKRGKGIILVERHFVGPHSSRHLVWSSQAVHAGGSHSGLDFFSRDFRCKFLSLHFICYILPFISVENLAMK